MKKNIMFIFLFAFVIFISGCNQNNVKDEKKDVYFDDICGREIVKHFRGNKDIIVGVIDSGIDISSPSISKNIYKNQNEIPGNGIDDDGNGYVDDINGWNFYSNNNSLYDSFQADYHGTVVANLISGKEGIAPNVTILPLKCFRGSEGSVKDIIRAINYGYNLGVRIFNCSWDMEKYDKDLYDTICKYNNAIFVCSAGKNNENINKKSVYPACFNCDNVIVVGGIDKSKKIYEYSGHGEKVDVYAPADSIYCKFPKETYDYMSGTSLAVAIVTGGIALVKDIDTEINCDIIKTRLKTCKECLDLEVLCGME